MRAVRLHATQDLRFEHIDLPRAPERDEATLSVTTAGICGSDLHNYLTGAWITRAPSVAGHEFTGIVTRVGDAVNHVAVGDRVIVDSRHICGTCPACLDGTAQVCESLGFLGEVIDGGFAEEVTLPARNLLKAPDAVPDRHLALAEPLAVALHALNVLGAPAGAEIVVTGAGPIGGFVTLLARRSGHPVAILDRNGQRAGLVAQATGARVVTPDRLTDMRFRYVVETTGSQHVIRAMLGNIAGASRVALVGIGMPAGIIDPVHLVEREIAVMGCHAFGNELEEIRDLLPELSPRLDPFIAAQIPLEDVPNAYTRLAAGNADGIKTIIICGNNHAD